ncbi:MAG: TIGR02710 family CRISPR-associated CARF protein [candidate division WOR-3 bacterium]
MSIANQSPEVLLMLVGTSPEPIIISIKKLQPKRVHFVCTADSEKYIDRVVADRRLLPSQFDKTVMQGLETQETYRVVKELHTRYQAKRVALDITGGKKAMVAGAALAGFLLEMPVYYVDFRAFDPEKRRPVPGSEFLAELTNPYQVFGSIEEAHADSLFKAGDYRAAQMLYEAMCGRIPDPRSCEVKRLVSAALAAWDDFAFGQACDHLAKAIARSEQFKVFAAQREVWKRQLNLLEKLKDDNRDQYFELLKRTEYFEAAAVSLVAKARRWLEAGQTNMAAIAAYRLLELAGQHRLALKGIDASKVQPEIRIQHDTAFRDLQKQIHGTDSGIREQLGLLDTWSLLYVLGDKVLLGDSPSVNDLKRLKSKLKARNELWPEHRNVTMDEQGSREFLGYAIGWLRRLVPDIEARADEVRPPDF